MVISELFKINYENTGYTSVIIALRRLRQDKTFKASLEYKTRPCLRKEEGKEGGEGRTKQSKIAHVYIFQYSKQ